MLTEEQKQHFEDDGYLIVPGVLPPEKVRQVREFWERMFHLPPEQRHPEDPGGVIFDIYNRYPEIRWLLFHEPTLSILRSLLGEDFVFPRENAAHLNRFGGWHKDTTQWEIEGQEFHWQPDFLMIEAAYYLQDNSSEWAGGLDVVPGSHRLPDPFLKYRRWTLRQKVWHRLTGRIPQLVMPEAKLIPTYLSLPIKAGDLVLFDFRLNHRASQPTKPITSEHDKYAIFIAASTNSPHVQPYHDFITHRQKYNYLQGFKYDPELLELARDAGVCLP